MLVPLALFPPIVLHRDLAFGLSAWAALIAVFFLSTLAHEAAHVVTARRVGIEAHAFVLHGLGGFVLLSRSGGTRGQRTLVSLAGSAANLALAALLFGLLALLKIIVLTFNPVTSDFISNRGVQPPIFTSLSFWQWRQPLGFRLAAFVLGYAAWINVALGLLNMLPGYPLDGGKVLHALLPLRIEDPMRSRIIGVTGLVSGYAVVGSGLSENGWGGIWLFGVGMMIASVVVLRSGRSFVS
jgi:Zn-dependent protease